jgi:hypothetical protein
MTTTLTATPHPVPRAYRSPLHALVWSFRKSRDNWKRKCLDVKAQLRQVRRRLDRLTLAKRTSPSLPAPSAKPVVAASPAPSGLAVLDQALVDLRHQVQANRELLEQSQKQHLQLLDLARQIQQFAADTPTSAPTQAPQPLSPISPQAPLEPKKGALSPHNR